jgi:glycosyltransferase involved in cell wall biosynthesis
MTHITTIIPAYNQENFIDAAIASAIEQVGDFTHEIIVSSDGSTDSTRDRIQNWYKRYPMLVGDISEDFNVGISENFRRLFSSASGEYIAILEGDDLWIDPEKLEKQQRFLQTNPDCSMVFSMINVRQLPSGADSLLKRQTSIKASKLRGEDFLADPSMNLIANFSSCLLTTSVARKLPDRMFMNRFNEIALAFFFERFGYVGFLKEVMSIYHQHSGGVWTGSSRKSQLLSGIETRKMVMDIADNRHAGAIQRIIEERYRKPLLELTSADGMNIRSVAKHGIQGR